MTSSWLAARQLPRLEALEFQALLPLVTCLLFTVIPSAGMPHRQPQQHLKPPSNGTQLELPSNHKLAALVAPNSSSIGSSAEVRVEPLWLQPVGQMLKYSNNLTRSMSKASGSVPTREYHTIEISGVLDLAQLADPMAGSESKPAARFSERENNATAGAPSRSKPAEAPTSMPADSKSRRQNHFIESLTESANNNKLLLLNYLGASTSARPKLSQRSRKFLQEIKNKRRITATSIKSEFSTTTTTTSTTTTSTTKRPIVKIPRPLQRADEELDELLAPEGRNETAPNQQNLTESASYKHEKWINFDRFPDEDETEASGDQPEVANLNESEVEQASNGEQHRGLELVAKQTRDSEQPTIKSRSSATTTIDGGLGKRVVIKHEPGTMRGNKLPTKLRQKIIDQFLKNGGDPQNIVVSDSTITTTSQSKKKTITTIYKVVPPATTITTNKSSKWPHSSEGIHGQTKSLMFDDDDDDDGEDDDAGSAGAKEIWNEQNMKQKRMRAKKKLFESRKRAPESVKMFKNSKAIKPKRKLKKIMVTRIEVPQSNEKPLNDHNELGEFYTGPQATVFGLKDRDEAKLSAKDERTTGDLDKVVHESDGKTHKVPQEREQNFDLNELEPDAEFRAFDKQVDRQQQLKEPPSSGHKLSMFKMKKSPSKSASNAQIEDKELTSEKPIIEKDEATMTAEPQSRNKQTIDRAVARALSASSKRRPVDTRSERKVEDRTKKGPKLGGKKSADSRPKPSLDERTAKTTRSPSDSQSFDDSEQRVAAVESDEAVELSERPSTGDEDREAPTTTTSTTTTTTTTTTKKPARQRQQARVNDKADSLEQLKRAVGEVSRTRSLTTTTSTTTTTTAAPSTTGGPATNGRSEGDFGSKTATQVVQKTGAASRSQVKKTGANTNASNNLKQTTTQSPTKTEASSQRAPEPISNAVATTPIQEAGEGAVGGAALRSTPVASQLVANGSGSGDLANDKRVWLSGGFLPSAAPPTTTLGKNTNSAWLSVANSAQQMVSPAPRTHNIMMLIDFDSSPYASPSPPASGNRSPLIQSGNSFVSHQWRPVVASSSASPPREARLSRAEDSRTLEIAGGQPPSVPTVSVSIFNDLSEQRRHQRQHISAGRDAKQSIEGQPNAYQQQLAYEQNQQGAIVGSEMTGQFQNEFAPSNQLTMEPLQSMGTPLGNYVNNYTHRVPKLQSAPAELDMHFGPTASVPFLYASSSSNHNHGGQIQQQAGLAQTRLVQQTTGIQGESAQTNRMIQHLIDEISKSALANGYQVDNRPQSRDEQQLDEEEASPNEETQQLMASSAPVQSAITLQLTDESSALELGDFDARQETSARLFDK